MKKGIWIVIIIVIGIILFYFAVNFIYERPENVYERAYFAFAYDFEDPSFCYKISKRAVASPAWFNPAGYRTMYTKSDCLMEVAAILRDQNLCNDVKTRRGNYGISKESCIEKVN